MQRTQPLIKNGQQKEHDDITNEPKASTTSNNKTKIQVFLLFFWKTMSSADAQNKKAATEKCLINHENLYYK